MKTFIKTKFKISDDQTNIDKNRLAANITEISYYIIINLTTNHYYKLLWFRESFEVKYNIGFGIPIEFTSQRKKGLEPPAGVRHDESRGARRYKNLHLYQNIRVLPRYQCNGK